MPATIAEPSDSSAPEASVAVDLQEEPKRRRRLLARLGDIPVWLFSLVIHVALLLILALVTIGDPAQIANVITAVAVENTGPEIEDFTIEPIEPGSVSEVELSAQPVDVSSSMEVTEPASIEPFDFSSERALADDVAPFAPPAQSLSQFSTQSLSSRSDAMRSKLLQDYGGNAASEAAVAEALKWLARHQMKDGSWSFHHHKACRGACGDPGGDNRAAAVNAATALALLPFLGAGQTHKEGQYREVVRRGLSFLVKNGRRGKRNGIRVLDLTESFVDVYPGNMYSHALASIVLCEAYAMTHDVTLREPAQNALNFTSFAQCSDGGWRYFPGERVGDTSVTGWQVMALKSGLMGYLAVQRDTLVRSMKFLDNVQSEGGSQYGYLKPETEIIPSCTAIGLLCRMYLGWNKTHPGIQQGVRNLGEVGVLKDDLYYDYYAAQVLRHYGGAAWDTFNRELRDWLVQEQSQSAGAKGSWYFPKSRSIREGGRLTNTAIATMILEVYYRHMPLYAESAASDEFPL